MTYRQAVGSHGSTHRLRVRAQAAQAGASATFSIRVPFLQLGFGDIVKLVGEQESFGGWSLTAAPALAWTEGHNWVGTFELAPNTYQFKVCEIQTSLHPHVYTFCHSLTEHESQQKLISHSLRISSSSTEDCISCFLPHESLPQLRRLPLIGYLKLDI